jgi:hypothetical protein
MTENAAQGALDNKKSNTSQKRSVVKTKRS